jgi:hypothetical protein
MCLLETALSEGDLAALRAAVRWLEQPGLAARFTALAGRPVELVAGRLPGGAAATIARATSIALDRALGVALYSLRRRRLAGGRALHSALASASGAVGGAFGLPALAVELPVSTTIMLRAIAAIAQREGEDLDDPRTGLACLEVFALGGAPDAGAGESGHFAVRRLERHYGAARVRADYERLRAELTAAAPAEAAAFDKDSTVAAAPRRR